jgi:hypothetical protein
MTPRTSRIAPRLVLCTVCLAGCAGEAPSWFREEARERGLDWVHVRGRTQRFWFPEIMGGGVGLLDQDGDGALDVYLVQSGDLAEPSPDGANRLFRNLGGARFADVTATVGGGDPGYGMGCAVGDADQDGDPDVYVTNVGPNTLLLNDGGTLGAAPLEAGVSDEGWGTSAAWVDIDADGDLDLYVVNYLRWSPEREIECHSPQGGRDYCSPTSYDAPARDVLYRNEGGGRFRDVSEAAGLGAAFGNGLGVASGDLDLDGWVDLYVANDMMPNQLWTNRGDGTFVDRALFSGCAVNRDGAAEAGMGAVALDVEDDGDLDLFVTHLRDETNTFYCNQGGRFSDQTSVLGLGGPSLPFTGFGVGFQDFDRDGTLDAYVANGAVTRGRRARDPSDPYAEPNQLFRGVTDAAGSVRFEELLPRGGTAEELLGSSRGAAFGDLDEDGDADVVVVDSGARVKLLLNQAAGGHWIGLRVLERSGGDAEGARLTLECSGKRRYRWVTSGGSYCSASDARALCGLGADRAPTTVVVRWTDQSEERFGPLEPGRKHVLRRGTGTPARD